MGWHRRHARPTVPSAPADRVSRPELGGRRQYRDNVDITANVLRISRSLLDFPDNRRYGYELMRETGLRSPSMYKALHRMQDEGWLTSYLETGDPKMLGRRRRRYYELTETGRAAVVDQLARWARVLRGEA